MCLSTAWEIDENGVRVKVCEYVSAVAVSGDTVTLTDLMGNEVTVTGILQSVDLVKNDILIAKTLTVTAGLKRYERIREIFNKCSGNQMRDVDIQEVDCGDIDAEVKEFCVGEEVTCDKFVKNGKVTVFDISTDGIAQRVTYTLIE
ncbi:MAG: CooT family nickel-binding protein [Spirochaetaceae bacterium]|jgi:predicted RNA-binding protein|nr:CooT family nickel-binding protein [Spirochaetaceae bacterium]